MAIFELIIEGFGFGSASILTTACLLPLYPGLIAFLAGNAENQRSRLAMGTMGVLVLAGILTMMLFIGFVLNQLRLTSGDISEILLPIVYTVVIIFGAMMLSGRNPFVRMQTVQAPMLKNPYLTAYVYGLLFGPMTIPCTGPIVLSAFFIGATSSSAMVEQLAYFLGVGLGFGWPLVILPLLALPVQHRLIGILTKHHVLLERVAGVLLIAVGVFGILTELLPVWVVDLPSILVFTSSGNLVYWAVVAMIALVVGYLTLQNDANESESEPALSGT